MRARHVALFFIGTALACGVPNGVFAATDVTDDIVSDTEWNASGSPYIVSSGLTIQSGATLTIDPGVVVQFDSDTILDVLGRLLAKGTSDAPVTFTSATGDRWYGIQFENQDASSSLDNVIVQYAGTAITDLYSKDLAISNATIKDGRSGIVTYGSRLSLNNFSAENIANDALDISYGSDVMLKDITLKNVGTGINIYVDSKADIFNLLIDHSQYEALAAYMGSSVQVASSAMTNVHGAIEIFNDSSADISNLAVDGVSSGDALTIFNNSKMTLNDSSISNTNYYDAIGVFNSGQLTAKNVQIINGSEDGIFIVNGGSLDMQDSVISGFTHGTGIADYGSSPPSPPDSLSLTHNEIKNNNVGIGSYSNNSSYAISNNSIHGNASYGLEFYRAVTVDVSHNFWGDPSGPYNDPGNLAGKGNGIIEYAPDSTIIFSPWLSYWGTPPVSNVLFLPGIETSHLYRPIDDCNVFISDCEEHKLWDPNGDADLNDLGLDASGESVRSDIYAKEGDIVSSASAYGQTDVFYDAFVAQMDGLKKSKTINDWKSVAYDWRLSLPDLIDKGTERYRKIFFEEATDTPYIAQTLRTLAATSKTGKVTIIAHSNGGLLAKALLQKLDAEGAAGLVDDVIFVGVPQSGAPQAVGGLLFGYGQALPMDNCSQLFLIGNLCSSMASRAAARTLAEQAPMAYHLAPSAAYFRGMHDTAHPVVSFTGTHLFQKEQSAYGTIIDSFSELSDFLQAKDGGRMKPDAGNVGSANVLGGMLLDYAEREHTTVDKLDEWTPPASITLYQIAGWGVDTISGVDFYENKKFFGLLPGYTPEYRPTFVEDGDGVVPVPSALLTSTSADNVKRYWVDIAKINNLPGAPIKYGHGDILEIKSLQDFIKNILDNKTDSLPDYILSSQPPPNTESKKLTFFLHSPLTLQLTDSSSGNVTGLAEDGSVSQNIPGSTYGEFGGVKYIIVPEGNAYTLTMHGQDSGTFSLDIQESVGGIVTTSSTIANVPTTASTLASLSISGGIDTVSPLTVDENNDGKNMIVVVPKVGETVNYESPTPQASSGGRRAISIPASIPLSIATATTSIIGTTSIATSAPWPAITAPRVLKHTSTLLAPTTVINTMPSFSQTASVYQVSQQSVLKKLGTAVYNDLHRIWVGLNRIFNLI